MNSFAQKTTDASVHPLSLCVCAFYLFVCACVLQLSLQLCVTCCFAKVEDEFQRYCKSSTFLFIMGWRMQIGCKSSAGNSRCIEVPMFGEKFVCVCTVSVLAGLQLLQPQPWTERVAHAGVLPECRQPHYLSLAKKPLSNGERERVFICCLTLREFPLLFKQLHSHTRGCSTIVCVWV